MSRNGNALILGLDSSEIIVKESASDPAVPRVSFSFRDKGTRVQVHLEHFAIKSESVRQLRDFLTAWLGEQADKKPAAPT